MDFKIPKIVKPLALSNYSEAIKDVWYVWVNPPTALFVDLVEVINKGASLKITEKTDLKKAAKELEQQAEIILGEQIKICARLLGETPDNQFAESDLRVLVEETGDTDPTLWLWIVKNIYGMIFEHRLGVKKA